MLSGISKKGSYFLNPRRFYGKYINPLSKGYRNTSNASKSVKQKKPFLLDSTSKNTDKLLKSTIMGYSEGEEHRKKLKEEYREYAQKWIQVHSKSSSPKLTHM